MIHTYMKDCFFVTECLQNGHFPIWNPYQDLGYPIHGDPNSFPFSPWVWFYGFLTGYSVYAFHIQFVLLIWIAGCGMFYLGKTLNLSNSVALLMAVAYMLSGNMVGGAQFLAYIMSATWLPWIMALFYKHSLDPCLENTLLSGLLVSLMITSGYPSIAMGLAIILIVWSLLVYWKNRQNKARVFDFVTKHLMLVLIIAIFSLAMWYSVFLIEPYMTRGDALSVNEASYDSFHPKAFISLLTPLPTVKAHYPRLDVGFSSMYFGMIMFIIYLVALVHIISSTTFRKKTLWVFWGGLFFLLLAMGNHSFVHSLVYKFLPFFDHLKHMAGFKIFFILSAIIIAGYQLNEKTHRFHRMVTWIVGAFLIGILIVAASNLRFDFTSYRGVKEFLDGMTFNQILFIQGCIQLVVLLLFYQFFLNKRSSKWLVILCVVEMLLSTWLHLPFTVVGQHSTNDYATILKNQPYNFPIPQKQDMRQPYQIFLGNIQTYQKKISWMHYDPFELKNLTFVKNSNLRQSLHGQELAFLTNDFHPLSDTAKFDLEVNSHKMFLNEADYKIVKEMVPAGNMFKPAIITQFSPTTWTVKTESEAPSLLVIMQNGFDHWKVTINGQRQFQTTVNGLLVATVVEKGTHEVEFKYSPPFLNATIWISMLSFLLGIIFVITTKRPFKRE